MNIYCIPDLGVYIYHHNHQILQDHLLDDLWSYTNSFGQGQNTA